MSNSSTALRRKISVGFTNPVPRGESGSRRAAITAFALLCLTVTPVQSIAAQTSAAASVPWNPDPAIAAFSGNSLSWEQEARLSLVASGTAAQSIPQYLERLRTVVRNARAATEGMKPPEAADKLLQFLHSGTFRNYRFGQTRVDVLLDTGTFNCVSSAVVYNLTAQALGLKTGAVETTDHAFSTVIFPDRTVDVETTTALGFDPGKKREFHNAFGKLTGFAYVPTGNYANRRTIDFRGLVALVLKNRMAEAQDRGDDRSPIGLAWDIWALEKSQDAKRLVIQSFSNYLAALNGRREYEQALSIVDRLESVFGRDAKTDSLAAAFAQNLIVARMSSGNFSGARDAVAKWGDRTSRPKSKWQEMILAAQAQSIYRTDGWQPAMNWLERTAGHTSHEIFASRTSLTLEELQKRMSGKDWSAVLKFWNSLPVDLKAEGQIKQVGTILEYNLSVDYHNRFAALMNRRMKNEATAVLDEGLKRFPTSSILLNDQRQLQRMSQ